MKRFLVCLLFLALVTLGCNLSTATPQGPTPESEATNTKGGGIRPTKTAAAPATEAATDTSTPSTNTSCNEISFYLDPTLAAGVQCETIPEFVSPTGIGTNPQYTKVSLQGYVLSDRFMKPVISVYSVDKFNLVLPGVSTYVTALQALIAGGAPGSSDLPLLPVQYARQLFFAQYAVIKFQNGNGIRYVTEYAQMTYPITNHEMFFSFQGLTTDGKYWVSIILPISHPSLLDNGDDTSSADWIAINSNATAYYAQKTTDLNAVLPKSFNPSIVMLNALIKSITITP
jgi:hypothetical protein